MHQSVFSSETLKDFADYGVLAIASRRKVNRYLNVVLWLCTLAGPAIAGGIYAGIFHSVHYGICVVISVSMAVVSFVHLMIIRKWPASVLSGMFALLAVDILLVLMANAHVGIYLTWFLVPVLSLLFVDREVFCLFTVVNYLFMVFSTWQSSFFYSAQRLDYQDDQLGCFFGYIGGFTIETGVMFVAAMALANVVTGYFAKLAESYQRLDQDKEHLLNNEKKIKEDLVMLESIAGIYEYVNLVDFREMFEVPLHDVHHVKRPLDLNVQSQTFMNTRLNDDIEERQLEDFKVFTDITTVQERLAGKKVIAEEFLNKTKGWFRAQYINIEDKGGMLPDKILYTVQNIDRDKRKEEHLIRIAITDELTGLYNRRCFENDMEEYRVGPVDEDLVIVSIDVNGLKTANDTLGHAAGDDLIRGASFCAQLALGTYGRVYRTGGDEFMAVIHVEDCDFIQDTIRMMTDDWTGREIDTLSLSVGYAAHKDYPDEDINGLAKIADAMMYIEKGKHYELTGKERRT